MIAKGNPHNNGPYLAHYLLSNLGDNERAEVGELRGFAASNIYDAFALGQLMAKGSRCQKPFFHVQVRTPDGETLSLEQKKYVADQIEKLLGLSNQPRALVFHQKNGHEHMHIVWSRIDEKLRAIESGLYKNKLINISRKLEIELGLTVVKSERDPEELTRAPARKEFEQARRLKTDLKAIREEIRFCWDRTSDGRAFSAALTMRGYVLARGDQRDFVIVDQAGGYHVLSKRILGVVAKDIRARLRDVEVSNLPGVEEAKAIQSKKILRGDEENMDIHSPEEERKAAIQKGEEDRHKAIVKEEEARHKAIADEQQEKETLAREQAVKQEEQAKEMQRQEERRKQPLEQAAQQEKMREIFKKNLARVAQQSAQKYQPGRTEGQYKELGINSSHSRYAIALSENYSIKDPYGSLARAAMAEYGAFVRDRQSINRQISEAKDPKERKALELRREIEFCEYMAITSDRIAVQSEVITGRLKTPEAQKQREQATKYREQAQTLRKEFREIHDRAHEQGRGNEGPPQPPEGERKAPGSRNAPEREGGKEPSVMVMEKGTRSQAGNARSLEDFIKDVPTPEKKPPLHELAKAASKDPSARKAYSVAIGEERKRQIALRSISRDMKFGQNIRADDVRGLSREDIEGLKKGGSVHLRQLVAEQARERGRDVDR